MYVRMYVYVLRSLVRACVRTHACGCIHCRANIISLPGDMLLASLATSIIFLIPRIEDTYTSYFWHPYFSLEILVGRETRFDVKTNCKRFFVIIFLCELITRVCTPKTKDPLSIVFMAVSRHRRQCETGSIYTLSAMRS